MSKGLHHRWAIAVVFVLLPIVLGTEQHAAMAQTASGSTAEWKIQRHLSVIADLGGVRFMPDEVGAAPNQLPTGTVLWAIGRSADGKYLYVQTDKAKSAESGWVAAAEVVAFGTKLIPIRELSESVAEALARPGESSPAPSSQVEASEGLSTDDSPLGKGEVTLTKDSTTTQAPESAFVTASRLNVRSGPGIEHDVVTQVTRGNELTIAERSTDGRWVNVTLSDGRTTGWVSAQFISIDNVTVINGADTQASTSLGATVAAELGGTLVFQQSIGGQIYVYNLKNGALRALTFGADPALSPDGTKIAFVRIDGLYLVDIDGANERVIFSGREGLGAPKWSPDGRTLIFTRGDEWLACVKWGGVKESCTQSSQIGEGKYKKIMYAIAAVDADGSNYRDVVSTKPARAPDWTDSGIVYQSIDGLQLTAVDRDAVNRLIHYDYLDPFYYDPDSQPGGNQIVFQSQEGSHWQIFTINSDGSGRRALTQPRTALVDQLPSSVAPAFSPDGQKIAFLSNRTPSGEAGSWALWTMNADGSNQQQLPINISFDYTYGVEQVVSWR